MYGNIILNNVAQSLSPFFPPQLGGTIFWTYGTRFTFTSNLFSNPDTELAIAVALSASTSLVNGVAQPPYTINAQGNYWGTADLELVGYILIQN